MKPINLHYVSSLLRPWAGSAEIDDRYQEFDGLDPNDESAVRIRIGTDLAPFFRRWDERSQHKAKLALQFALTFLDDNFFRETFDAELIIFEPHEPVRELFEWLWEELFDSQDWRLPGKANDYQLENAIWQPTLIRLTSE